MAKKLKIALLFGGRSVEHEISIRSARNVDKYIDRDNYEVFLIGIDKKGKWFLNDAIGDEINAGKEISLKLDTQNPGILITETQKSIDIDLAFPILHGTDGEDGSIQGLFKAVDIPVVGSGVLGSAVAMDKIISKKILKECDVPVAEYLEFDKEQINEIQFDEIVQKLGLPFIVKSAGLGSSVGVNKVSAESDFANALNEGFKYDSKIIIEQFIQARELECAVIGNKTQKASNPGEIVLVKDYDFYTYTAKYLDEDAVKIELPAKLDEKVKDKIQQVSIQAYNALRCDDFARVDLFLTEQGEVLVNEINTIPGFTSASMFPMMWQQLGMTYSELISELINMCLNRYNDLKNQETHYNVVN